MKSGFDIDMTTTSKLIKQNKQALTSTYLEKILQKGMYLVDGIKDFNEMYFNPICFIQFLGVKIINPMYNIFWRYTRARPSSMAEFIAMILKLKLNVPLFEIPKTNYITPYYTNTNSKEIVERSPSEYKFYIESIKKKNKQEHQETPVNQKKFIKTTKFYLQKRYGLKMPEQKILNIIKNHTHHITKLKKIN